MTIKVAQQSSQNQLFPLGYSSKKIFKGEGSGGSRRVFPRPYNFKMKLNCIILSKVVMNSSPMYYLYKVPSNTPQKNLLGNSPT